MTLYHGSNTEINAIILDKCRPYKDFGKGFYTSTLQENAWRMAKRAMLINREGSPCVTAFFFDDNFLSDTSLKIKQFAEPDNEWARFVINNRNSKFKDIQCNECNTDAKYDIAIGPAANDDIVALMEIFITGLISDEILARELTFRKLSSQISFHTEKSIAKLIKTEVYRA